MRKPDWFAAWIAFVIVLGLGWLAFLGWVIVTLVGKVPG